MWECQPHTLERRLSSWAICWFQAPGCPIVRAGGTLPYPSNAPTCLRPKEAMPAPTPPWELASSSNSSGTYLLTKPTVPRKPTGLYLEGEPVPHIDPKTRPMDRIKVCKTTGLEGPGSHLNASGKGTY